MLARAKPGETVHSSRRYLLQKARERIGQGESVATLQRSLGLSFDEARLLERGEKMTVSRLSNTAGSQMLIRQLPDPGHHGSQAIAAGRGQVFEQLELAKQGIHVVADDE